MTSDAEKILSAALRLNDQERAAIAALLIESLDPHYDEDCDEVWAAESKPRGRDSERRSNDDSLVRS